MNTLGNIALATIAALTLSCRPNVDLQTPVVFDSDDETSLEHQELSKLQVRDAYRDEDFSDAAKAAYDAETAVITEVTRAALDHVLDQGVATFLARVDVSPHLDVAQRFIGWEIVEHTLAGVDLKPGDIITRVNEHKLERPTQVQEMWDKLRDAKAIQIKGRRAGKPFLLRVDVITEQQRELP